MAKRPNCLSIITDQHRADHLDCYGNPIVKTPNIDAIAAKGLAFDEFHVSCPICMPNRATILTGRTPTATGVRQNGIPLSLASVTFVDLLKADGYNTAPIGKGHFQNISKQEMSRSPRPSALPSGPHGHERTHAVRANALDGYHHAGAVYGVAKYPGRK